MSKQTIRKLIFTILFAIVVVVIFLFNYAYKKNKKTETVSMVKQIIDEKYDKVGYSLDNKYIYGMDIENGYYHYDIYDLNGNKHEDFDATNELNIVALSEYYYITYDDIYRLYNYSNQELLSSKEMTGLNDYLIKTSNNVINYKGELLYENVDKVTSYHNNAYFNLDNSKFIDEEGELIYDNCSVIEEIKNSLITDYLIIRKDNKYYTYFTSVDTTMGSGFDSYYKKDDEVYIFIGYEKSQIYSSGVRSSSDEIKIDNKIISDYNLEPANIINDELMFVKNNKKNSYGLLNYNSGKYYDILDNVIDWEMINDRIYLFKNDDTNVLYDIKLKEVIYKSKYNLDNVIYFKNGYKTIKIDDEYVLLDDKENKIKSNKEQIVLYNEAVVVGTFDNSVLLLDKDNYINAEIIKIGKSDFIKYERNNKKIYQNLHSKKTYSSDEYIGNSNNYIMLKEEKSIKFIDLKNQKETCYRLDEDENVLSLPIKDSIIIGNDKNIKVINSKGKELKEIKDTVVEDIYYNKNNNKIVIITSDSNKKSVKKGSYVCE